jgi:hypothetical protein
VQWLKRFLTRRPREAGNTALWVYVRCRRCGEAIQIRADRRYDLASEWRNPGEPGPAYSMHKDIVGDRCFQRISIDLGFDTRFQIVEQQIEGGELLTAEAYAAAVASSPSQKSPDED